MLTMSIINKVYTSQSGENIEPPIACKYEKDILVVWNDLHVTMNN